MNKYLLIGSAPYIREWYEIHGQSLFKAGFELIAMNNAWVIDPDRVRYWIHANDFHVNGTHHPTTKHLEGWHEKETNNNERIEPYNYDFKEGTGTTILNALCQILNWGQKCIVAIAGSDCIYDGDKSHFYEGGTSDPLRYGEEWLVGELERVGRFYKTEGCQIFNIGGQERTLLPYEKKTPKELII